MSDSPILCTIDLEAPGKQFGRLQVPRSSNASGWSNPVRPDRLGRERRRADGARARRRPRRRARGPGRRAQPRARAAAGARHRPRDRDPVRLDRRLARLHAALAVGREHEPLVPGLADRAGRRAARALPLDRAVPALRPRRRHAQRRAHRPLPALVRDALGRRRRAAARRWSTGCSHWNTDWCCVYIDIAGTGLLVGEAERQGKIVVSTELGGGGHVTAEIHRLAVERPPERAPPLRRARGRGRRRARRSACPSRCS